MKTSDFDYDLPEDRIAQTPVEPRDSSRLLVLHREDGALEHVIFRDLPRFLRPGDLLVANESRVIPARLQGRRTCTGGALEVLLLRRLDECRWEALIRGSRVRAGLSITFARPDGGALEAVVEEAHPDGLRKLRFREAVEPYLEVLGAVPLPPYIRAPLTDPERYQTVYARVAGSVAAPTAGLHFTPSLIEALQARGVEFAFVVLHIGLDTFRPVETEEIQQHRMHAEWCRVPAEVAEAVRATRARGGRVVAVGTTVVRALETAALAAEAPERAPAAFEGWSRLFIYPGFRFQVVDALITNFHLPRSTLLMLVSAFAGRERVLAPYREAIAQGYRFYTFGDAMLIL
ncbi:MAG: tRNA preQ1(34) S-adenosylmethionine ribosyltransferase-isomerase QueA [Chloroflexia bacterium]